MRRHALGGALALAAALALGAPPAASAQSARATEGLKRIFASRDFASDRFGPARWREGGAYTTLERSSRRPAAADIVRYDTASGARYGPGSRRSARPRRPDRAAGHP